MKFFRTNTRSRKLLKVSGGVLCLMLIFSSTISAREYPNKINDDKPFTSYASMRDMYLKIYNDQQLNYLDREELIERVCEHDIVDCDRISGSCTEEINDQENELVCYPERFQVHLMVEEFIFNMDRDTLTENRLKKIITTQRSEVDEDQVFKKIETIINNVCSDTEFDCNKKIDLCIDDIAIEKNELICYPDKYRIMQVYGRNVAHTDGGRLFDERFRIELEFAIKEELRLLQLENDLARSNQLNIIFTNGSSDETDSPFDITDKLHDLGKILTGEKAIELLPSFVKKKEGEELIEYLTEAEFWQDLKAENLPSQDEKFNTSNDEVSLSELLWMTIETLNELNSYPLAAGRVAKNLWEPADDTTSLGGGSIGASVTGTPPVSSDEPVILTAETKRITDELDGMLKGILTTADCGKVEYETLSYNTNNRLTHELFGSCRDIREFNLIQKRHEFRRVVENEILNNEHRVFSLSLANLQGFFDFMVENTDQRLQVWQDILGHTSR